MNLDGNINPEYCKMTHICFTPYNKNFPKWVGTGKDPTEGFHVKTCSTVMKIEKPMKFVYQESFITKLK